MQQAMEQELAQPAHCCTLPCRLVLGDIILSINASKIKSASDLYRILDKSGVGDKLDCEVLRGDSTTHLTITLEASQ